MSEKAKFYTISEFAKAIGVHPQTIRRWDRTGKLQPNCRTLGGQRKYTQSQVDAYLSSKK